MTSIFFNKIDGKKSRTPEQLVITALSSLQTFKLTYNPKECSSVHDYDNDDNTIDNFDTISTSVSTDNNSTISKSQVSTSIDDEHMVAVDELQKNMNQMKGILYGDSKTNFIVDEEKANELTRHIIQNDLLVKLVEHIEILPFEARKDTAHIFNNLLRKNQCDFPIYVHEHFEEFVFQLVKCYDNPDAALSCGSMLRECIRFDELANKLLYSDYLWLFFDDYVHLRNFEIASDSFNTLRDLLTTPKNKTISSVFLQSNYELVMQHYENLLNSDNFVTRWRSLK